MNIVKLKAMVSAMNVEKIKLVFCAILSVICLTSMVVYIYNEASSDTLKLIRGESYIYYDWKQIPLLFLLPVAVLFDLFIICTILLPGCRKITAVIVRRLIMPVSMYSIAATIFGVILSIIISFYPLGTNYYKCDSTSIVSSGSYYAKSKEICKQRAYSLGSESETKK